MEFADFWLADQLNSLVVVLMDLEYLACFYIFELQWSNSKGLLPKIKGDAQLSLQPRRIGSPASQLFLVLAIIGYFFLANTEVDVQGQSKPSL